MRTTTNRQDRFTSKASDLTIKKQEQLAVDKTIARELQAAIDKVEAELAQPARHFQFWVCRRCGHEVYSTERPAPIRWTDGHVCGFIKGVEA
jgi:rubrerythrin